MLKYFKYGVFKKKSPLNNILLGIMVIIMMMKMIVIIMMIVMTMMIMMMMKQSVIEMKPTQMCLLILNSLCSVLLHHSSLFFCSPHFPVVIIIYLSCFSYFVTLCSPCFLTCLYSWFINSNMSSFLIHFSFLYSPFICF